MTNSKDLTQYSCELFKVEIVEEKILLVTLTRPKALNSIPRAYHKTFVNLWQDYENDDTLVCAIITGTGRVFCAGADLKDWLKSMKGGSGDQPSNDNSEMLQGGFLGLSNRTMVKPVIAALNGSSFGGGTEAVVNCDLAVASRAATLSLPEVRRGVTALAGALPRISRQHGLKRAAELALVGEPISAETALSWGLINKVVDKPEDVLPAALDYARKIVLGSPEAVQASLVSLRRGFEETKLNPVEASHLGARLELRQVTEMDNIMEGLSAFNEKRNPNWHPNKLSKL